MPRATPKVAMVQAKEAIVITVGARPIEYQRRIVRDRRTGELKEIDVHELPPLDEGDEGMPYAFARGEKVPADHPAVLDCPSGFRPVEA
jgi:hypothetical protein